MRLDSTQVPPKCVCLNHFSGRRDENQLGNAQAVRHSARKIYLLIFSTSSRLPIEESVILMISDRHQILSCIASLIGFSNIYGVKFVDVTPLVVPSRRYIRFRYFATDVKPRCVLGIAVWGW